MNAAEKYLFDIQGFLVVRQFLPAEMVARLNEAMDANDDKRREDGNSNTGTSRSLKTGVRRGFFDGMLTWEHPWCDPFREMLAYPKLVPYLNTMLGRGWRMDHAPFILCGGRGAEGLVLHGPGARFDGAQYYAYKAGEMRCGMIVCQFQLHDAPAGAGGFCCVPGSHKANYPCPEELINCDGYLEALVCPEMKAGDMLIFNEATTHGTLPWQHDRERRALLYRYSPKYLHFAGGVYASSFPEWVSELTPAQQAVLEPPYIYNRPLVEDDGASVVRPLRDW